MRILDNYIVKRVISGYIFVLAVFIGLHLIISLFSELSDILKAKPSIFILIQYYFNSLPLIILRVSPFSLLISTLYTLGELNKNNEIISMRSSGISIFKISFPIIFLAFFVSISIFFLQEKILIHSQKKVEDIKSRFIKKDLSSIDEENNLAFTSGNMIFFAQKFLPKEKSLKNVTIFEENKNRRISKQITCKSIVYEYGFWVGYNVIEYAFDEEGNIINVPQSFKTKRIHLAEKPRELIFKKSIFSQFSSLNKLKKEIDRLKRVKAKNLLSNLIVNYHQKIADPFSHFFLIIGVLPLALEIKKRKVTLSALGTGFIFGFGYYALSSFGLALGKSGVLLPVLGAWLAPIFFLTVGITGLLLIR